MNLKKGNMWSVYDHADLFLITTNSTVKSTGALVMGRGIAKEASDRFPNLGMALGQTIKKRCGNLGLYYLLVSPHWPKAKLGAFQVKAHYKNQASVDIISESIRLLNLWCAQHPGKEVHLNFPGIGNGRLERLAVTPLLRALSDQVTVWEF